MILDNKFKLQKKVHLITLMIIIQGRKIDLLLNKSIKIRQISLIKIQRWKITILFRLILVEHWLKVIGIRIGK